MNHASSYSYTLNRDGISNYNHLFFAFTSYFRLVKALVKFLFSDFGVPMMRAVMDLFDDVVDTLVILVMFVVSRRGVLSCVEFYGWNRIDLRGRTIWLDIVKFTHQGSIV